MNRPTAAPQPYARLAMVMAAFVGAAIPLRAAGVALQQGALGIGLVLALILLFNDPAAREHLKTAIASTSGKLVALVFVAFAMTVPFSHAPLGSIQIGGRTGIFVLGAAILWAVLRARTDTHRFVFTTLITISFVLTVLVLSCLLGFNRLIWLFRGDFAQVLMPTPDFISAPNAFKAFANTTMCLIPAVALAGRRLDGSWRWWGYAFAPLALGVMVLTYSRASLAGVIAMAIVGVSLLALAKRRHTKALLATGIAAISGIFAWITTREEQSFEALQQVTDNNAQVYTYLPEWLLDPHRQNIWKFAYEHFLNHPWVGNGIDQLNRLPGAHVHVPGLDQSAYMVPSHPHNWVLEILSETGLVGFTPLAIALVFIAWKLAQRYMRTDNASDLALLALTAGFWASALFNFSIWAVWWQLTFYVLFAIIAATRDTPAP